MSSRFLSIFDPACPQHHSCLHLGARCVVLSVTVTFCLRQCNTCSSAVAQLSLSGNWWLEVAVASLKSMSNIVRDNRTLMYYTEPST